MSRFMKAVAATAVAVGGSSALVAHAASAQPIEGIPGCYWFSGGGGAGFCVFADGVWVFDSNGNYWQLPNSPGHDPILG